MVAEYEQRVGSDACSEPGDVPEELRGRDVASMDVGWRTARFSTVLTPPVTPPIADNFPATPLYMATAHNARTPHGDGVG